MKYLITLILLMLISTTVFSQDVTVKKVYLDKVIEELRTKDLFEERLKLQDTLISGLEKQLGTTLKQRALETQRANSYALEAGQWRTIAQNNERLWKADRAKKRRRGWIIGGAIAAAVAKGTYNLYTNLK